MIEQEFESWFLRELAFSENKEIMNKLKGKFEECWKEALSYKETPVENLENFLDELNDLAYDLRSISIQIDDKVSDMENLIEETSYKLND